jgi:uncharacterized peroxidase-related enzyme
MPRIQPVNVATATGEAAAQLAATKAAFGGTPNLFTTAAQSPAALEAMLGLFKSTGKSSLGAKIGEQIAVAVAQANGCGYCLSAHTAIGAMHGLDAATLAGARHAKSSSSKTAAILTLALAIVHTRGQVSDDALATARRAGVTDTEIVEIVAHVALNVFTNYLNNVAQTTIDFPEVALDAVA